MSDVAELREELQDVLARAERWLGEMPSLGLDGELGQLPGTDEDLQVLRVLRIRGASALISVAMLGGYSSGKSFLVSGLQRKLEYEQILNDDGLMDDQYIGILPAASKATTACPASVVPVEASGALDASDRGFLRVRFTDTDEWEDIGASLVPLVVAAYATQDTSLIAQGRPRQHRDRTVAEVEILLADAPLLAKLYDLPGFGSPHPMHDQIMRESMADADCFIYVTQATATLSDQELDLIREVYKLYMNSEKRVVWVVTGIDRARERDPLENRPTWETTIDRNNAYLNEHFTLLNDQPDRSFIGQGFIGVSPALETRGQWLLAQGDKAGGNRAIAASRMKLLRDALADLISTETGPRHIAKIAAETHTIVAPRHRVLTEIRDTARLPLEQLSTERQNLEGRHASLQAAIDTTRSHLEGMLEARVRVVDQTFGGLAAYLHAALDEQIRSTDLTKPKEANRIEVHRYQLLHEWAQRSGGPAEESASGLAAFTTSALTAVRSRLRDSDPLGDLGIVAQLVDLDQLTVPPSKRYRAAQQDIVPQVAALAGAMSPLTAGLIAALTTVGGPVLWVPAGVAAGAGLLYAAVRHQKSKTTSLDLLREEWINDLDRAAAEYRQAFTAAMAVNGVTVIERAKEILAERLVELSHKIVLINERIEDPDNIGRQQSIERLTPCWQEGGEIVSALKRLAHSRAPSRT